MCHLVSINKSTISARKVLTRTTTYGLLYSFLALVVTVSRGTCPIFFAPVLNFVQNCRTWLSGATKVKDPCADQNA